MLKYLLHIMFKTEDSSTIRVFPLAGISFLLAFNYYILRALKDTLMVTATDAGAEVLPFVKVWLLLPTSFFMATGFAWMTSRFSLRTAFTVTLSFFLSAFTLFAFILFPYREVLHPHMLADSLETFLPRGWIALAAVVRYWTYAFFYVVAENWSVIVYSVLFFGFANEITKLKDAQRYYPMLTLAGTVAALVAGPVAVYLSGDSLVEILPWGKTPWEKSLYSLLTVVLFCGAAAIAIFLRICPQTIRILPKEDHPKASFFESLYYLRNSKYLIAIAVIGLSYNMMMNLTEVVWKDEVFKLHPHPNDYNAYLSYVTLATGVVSTLLTLFVSRQSLRFFGWEKTALVTPVTALITGGVFFSSLMFQRFGSLSLALTTLLGSVHFCLICSGKYTLFDMTKELAFIPLNSQEKLHGKAAIDGVGSRLGKAGSSVIFQGLLLILPTISACVPIIAIMTVLSLAVCIHFVTYLGEQRSLFKQALDEV